MSHSSVLPKPLRPDSSLHSWSQCTPTPCLMLLFNSGWILEVFFCCSFCDTLSNRVRVVYKPPLTGVCVCTHQGCTSLSLLHQSLSHRCQPKIFASSCAPDFLESLSLSVGLLCASLFPKSTAQTHPALVFTLPSLLFSADPAILHQALIPARGED